MLSRLKTLSSSPTGRLLLGGLLIHAILVSILVTVMVTEEAKDHKRLFVAHARDQANLLWARFDSHRTATGIAKQLEEMVLGGQADYAEYVPPGAPPIRPVANGNDARFEQDAFFGQHDDHMYYVAAPSGPGGGQLRLGFSEAALEEELRADVRFAAMLGGAYLLFALAALAYLGRRSGAGSSGAPPAAALEPRQPLPRELELIRREARQRAVLESASEGIVTVDAEGRIESFNRAAEKLFDCPAGQAIGTFFDQLLDPGEAAKFYRQDGEPAPCSCAEFVGRRRSGKKCQLMLSVNEVAVADSRCFTIFIQDIGERLAYEAQLAHKATHDPLTGLPNRALFHDRLNQVLAHAQRENNVVGLFFLDLDRFKYINDSLGHHIGDELLIAVAKRLKGCLRTEDTLARLGGDEFTVILPHLERPTNSVIVAENIVRTLEKPFHIGGKELSISCSIGIAFFPFDGKDGSELSRNADSAMYATKNLGGHGFQFYSKPLNAKAACRLEMESGLHYALERGELSLHYQPLADIRTQKIIGVEALLRWRHPEKGLVPPGEFLPVAEESGVIIPVSEWVLETACRQARAWQDEGLAVSMAVNLSASQFQAPGFLQAIGEALQRSGLPPERLHLELTEAIAMARGDDVAAILRKLKQLGVILSLDDFGTGGLSLGYLKQFPIDTLKVDRSFVRDIGTGDGTTPLAAAIVALARSLHMGVVAEGVETEAQLAYLRGQGCDLFQGFHFSRPLPADELTELLRRNLQGDSPLGKAA